MNQFDFLRQLGQMGEQLQKMFDQGFMKNLMTSNGSPPNVPAVHGINENANFLGNFENMWNWGNPYPRVDLYQTRNELIAVLEIPGLEKASDIQLTVEPNQLTVKGNHAVRYPGVSQDQFLITERKRGAFQREISLPVRVLTNKVRAHYRQGLIEVRMIKDEANRGKLRGNSIPIDFE